MAYKSLRASIQTFEIQTFYMHATFALILFFLRFIHGMLAQPFRYGPVPTAYC